MRFLLYLFITVLSFHGSAQDISGIWRGKRTQQSGGCFTEYFQELQISVYNNQILGRSYSYIDEDRYTKILFKGEYDPANHKVNISESLILEYKIPEQCIPCIKTYMLDWSNLNNEEYLSGVWEGYQSGNRRECPPGRIRLKKETSSLFVQEKFTMEEFERNFQLPLRPVDNIQTLFFSVPDIKIELYDNAEIDGDTVSVYLNNNLILHKKRLTDKPIVLYLTAVQGDEYELVMYAENEGSIPPNTSLMYITAGEDRYELKISTSRQKSASLKFRYVKKEMDTGEE